MPRDIRISGDVASVIGQRRAESLRSGPEPSAYKCIRCGNPADAEADPTSIVVYKYPKLINILFAHASCMPSIVEHRDDFDIKNLLHTHVVPTLFTGPGDDQPGLVVEPIYPVELLDPSGEGANTHISAWLEEGLALLTAHELLEPPTAAGWRAVLVPGERGGDQQRVTVLCRVGAADGPLTVADDASIMPGARWLDSVRCRQQIALYAGLTDLSWTRDRSAETVANALVTAAHRGLLTGGTIEAAQVSR